MYHSLSISLGSTITCLFLFVVFVRALSCYSSKLWQSCFVVGEAHYTLTSSLACSRTWSVHLFFMYRTKSVWHSCACCRHISNLYAGPTPITCNRLVGKCLYLVILITLASLFFVICILEFIPISFKFFPMFLIRLCSFLMLCLFSSDSPPFFAWCLLYSNLFYLTILSY